MSDIQRETAREIVRGLRKTSRGKEPVVCMARMRFNFPTEMQSVTPKASENFVPLLESAAEIIEYFLKEMVE